MKSQRKTRLKEKGITLIALVVTIIILLILAGVAIASVTGDNGLFGKAREATNTYKDAERDEGTALGTAEGEIDKLLNPNGNGGGSGDGDEYAKGNTKITVSDGSYYIPDGFKLAEDSGKTINEGIVVEDKNGNQWVWIPCYVDGGVGADVAGAVKYDRYAFSIEGWDYSQTKLTLEDGSPDLDGDGSQKIIVGDDDSYYFHEAINSTDEASVRQFGGFYIGRYEAGDGTVTNADTPRLRTSSDKGETQSHTVTIKKGQAPYTYVTYSQCVTLSNGFASENNYNSSKMYTKLCSSYAWDTAIRFIETRKTEYSTFGSTSKIGGTVYGNCCDITVSYKDITGASQTKNNGEGLLIPTGQTRAVCNIYDLDGNAEEYISESYADGDLPFVNRGGIYNDVASYYPAGYRHNRVANADGYRSFRPTLFLSNAVS